MHSRCMQCLCALVGAALGLWTSSTYAGEVHPRYLYISLDHPKLPPGFISFGIAFPGRGEINDQDQVAGTVSDALGTSYAAVYEHGIVRVLQSHLPSAGIVINGKGHVGGFVLNNAPPQAAIFRQDQVEVIPRQSSDEILSFVDALNDADMAVVRSIHLSGESLALYANGTLTPIGPQQNLSPLGTGYINRQGFISGTTGTDLFGDARAFRLAPRTGQATLLSPIDSDPLSWSQGIDDRGNVLGYSFGAGEERIGVWDRLGKFELYFTEGNAEFPTVSNELLFNDEEEIVITFPLNDSTSYLVPRPGIRLDLAALTQNPPSWPKPFEFITGFNDDGNMVGVSGESASGDHHQFLLKRIEDL